MKALDTHIAHLAAMADEYATGSMIADVDSRWLHEHGWDEVPNKRTGIRFLMRSGDLRCFSEYGSYTSDCAPVAWRLAYLVAREQGEPVTFADLEHAMGLVVNDHEDVRYIVNQYGHGNYGRS